MFNRTGQKKVWVFIFILHLLLLLITTRLLFSSSFFGTFRLVFFYNFFYISFYNFFYNSSFFTSSFTSSFFTTSWLFEWVVRRWRQQRVSSWCLAAPLWSTPSTAAPCDTIDRHRSVSLRTDGDGVVRGAATHQLLPPPLPSSSLSWWLATF